MKFKKNLLRHFSKNANTPHFQKAEKYILNEIPTFDSDLVFVRHGQSTFNIACENYRQKHTIPYIWKQLCNHQGFDQTVLFNPTFIDCPLTQFGKQECKKTRKIMQKESIDCVLVSPQFRALQTCGEIFKGTELPIYVEPMLVGPLRSCSDVNRSTRAKKIMFPEYNFQPTEEYKQLWYLDYLCERQRKICQQRFEQKQLTSLEDQRVELVSLLKQRKIHEDAILYRQRIQKVKYKISEYRQRFKKIAIVAHYYTIEYLGAMQYNEHDGSPVYYLDIKNCKPYYASLKDMLAYKQQQI